MPRAAYPCTKKTPEAALKIASDLKGLKGRHHPILPDYHEHLFCVDDLGRAFPDEHYLECILLPGLALKEQEAFGWDLEQVRFLLGGGHGGNHPTASRRGAPLSCTVGELLPH